MAEKRLGRRCRKRLQVRFGKSGPHHIAFTEDISPNGLFLRTGQTFPPRTLLQFEIKNLNGDPIRLEGIVMWGKKVHPSVIHKLKAGMGIRITRFLGGKEEFFRLQESAPPGRSAPIESSGSFPG